MRIEKHAIVDTALILGGAGLSTLFVSTDGNGQNPLPVGAGMLLVASITGLVSFALAWRVRSLPLAIVGSAVVTEMGFLLFFVCRVAYGRHLHPHADEELYLLPLVFAVVTAPTVLLSSIGFGRVASRVYNRGRADAPTSGGPAKSIGHSRAAEKPPSVS